jgi:dynein light chain 4
MSCSCFPFLCPVCVGNFSWLKPSLKSSDMPTEVQSEAVDLIVSAIDNIKTVNGTYEVACKQVKEAMDRKFGPSWHCIIGEGFGFNCTFQTKSMIFLYYQGNMAILLFKC